MKSFERFKDEKEVQERTENPEQAESLIQKAGKRLDYVKDRKINNKNADLILEDSYEAIREAVDSFLILNGLKSYSHEASIVYAFENLGIDYDTANRLNKFKKLRNDSKYRGEDITKKEAKQTRQTAQKIIPEFQNKFQEEKTT